MSDSFTSNDQNASVAVPAKVSPKNKPQPRRLPPFNVVLLDDDGHSYVYVIRMLQQLFGFSQERGQRVAEEVDHVGRAIILTTHKELAELKCAQICGYGADQLVADSAGSMSAVVEPAPA